MEMASRIASGETVPSCSMTAWPIETSAREIPGTPESDVKTARTQWEQLIPFIFAVVTISQL